MKKNEHNSRDRYTSDFDIINRELGSMDLEPPKVYRPEQQSVIDRRNESRRRKDNGKKKKQSKPRTKNKTKTARIPATKQEQQKKRKQKKLVRKILSIAVTVIIAIIVVAVLCLTVFFKIDTINISGNSKYTKEQITSSLTITKDKNLFLVDRDSAAAKLKEALPYIHDVEISRKLPSTLNVYVYISGATLKSVVYSHTPFSPSLSSATPGPSNSPKGVWIFRVGRKSPDTVTFTALGAK